VDQGREELLLLTEQRDDLAEAGRLPERDVVVIVPLLNSRNRSPPVLPNRKPSSFLRLGSWVAC